MFFEHSSRHMFDEVLVGFALLGIISYFVVLILATNVLNKVAPENRRMEPGQVWLNLIPMVNLMWIVVTIERVGESIRNELLARGRNRSSDNYAKSTGLIGFMLMMLTALLISMEAAPLAAFVFVFVFISAVVYAAQLAGYSRRLRDLNSTYSPPEDEGW